MLLNSAYNAFPEIKHWHQQVPKPTCECCHICSAVCDTVDVCPSRRLPNGRQQQPAACTSDSMMPNSYEMEHSKTFSCMCGGLPGDVSTEWACKQQPQTYWMFNMMPHNQSNSSRASSPVMQYPSASAFSSLLGRAAEPESPTVDFHVVERGGIMSNDVDWHKFQYAYAGVWEGNITGCSFSYGACTRPLEGDDCFVARCEGAKVVCPPPCKRPAVSCLP